jgi:hypothetical protein
MQAPIFDSKHHSQENLPKNKKFLRGLVETNHTPTSLSLPVVGKILEFYNEAR